MTTSVDVEGIGGGMEKFKAKKVLYAKANVKLAVTTVKKTTFERLYIELRDKGKDKKFYGLEKSTLRNIRILSLLGVLRLKEVKHTISKMSRQKMTRLDQTLVEIWKSTNKVGLKWLTKLFNVIFQKAKMPEEWMWSTMVPLYKNKGDIQNCKYHKDIKLLSYTMKDWREWSR
ncbi:hypothetical protein H5410_042401 [Solanum commersonii]|uniref:Uncharacterized protein n=1 Tax=Solanum commersonii TaxID=4109 RepID=A0A9J5XW98_SOLCO|nr:hypothetical protein H5410_042401 [Solanum commersonii]